MESGKQLKAVQNAKVLSKQHLFHDEFGINNRNGMIDSQIAYTQTKISATNC